MSYRNPRHINPKPYQGVRGRDVRTANVVKPKKISDEVLKRKLFDFMDEEEALKVIERMTKMTENPLRTRFEAVCHVCGILFPTKGRYKRYCSDQCRNKARYARRTV